MHFIDGSSEGSPKALNNLPYDCLKCQDGYVIRTKTIKLHKHLAFPLTSKLNEDRIRMFTKGMENEIVYIYIYTYILTKLA